ncbi:hypothetical protein H4R34_002465 [Dimargaris verticillata]|uniref:Uncharacterized protein n=1 Tax=Dimargaris verticillata TaxID=2761393 RepID=A0A9W8B8R8_9FUNG|nr:hypothetical protein H4R34_002465 [Dimargaris verticillata]
MGASEIIISRENIVANFYEESLSHAWFVATRILPTSPYVTTCRPSTIDFSTLKRTRLATRMAEAASELQQHARKRKRKHQCTAAQKRLRVTTDQNVKSEALYSAPLLPVTTDESVMPVPLASILDPTCAQSAGLCLPLPTGQSTTKGSQCSAQGDPLFDPDLLQDLGNQCTSPVQVKTEFDLDSLEPLFASNSATAQTAITNQTPVKLEVATPLTLPTIATGITATAADRIGHSLVSRSPSEPPVSASSPTSTVSPKLQVPCTQASSRSAQQPLGVYMITQERLLGFVERPVFHGETMETLSNVFDLIKDQPQLDRVLLELSNLLNGNSKNILNGRSKTWGTFGKADTPSGMIRLYDRMTKRIHVTHGKKACGKKRKATQSTHEPWSSVRAKRPRRA